MLSDLGVGVGYGAGTGLASVADVREAAVWAASAGFRSLWVSQVFGVDPIVALAAIAAETRSLTEVGTSVVPVVGRHPLALAAQALTAQSALAGRFTLGIGTSHEPVVEGLFGESFARPFTRVSAYIDALLPLLRGEAANVVGSDVVARGRLAIEAPRCPVLLAALGPRMLELAGRVADGTSVGSCGPRTIAGHIAPVITASATQAGRPAPRIVALVQVCVTDDPAGARAYWRQQSGGYDSLPSYRRVLDREGVASSADLLLAGRMEDIEDGLAAYAAAGVTDLRIMVAARHDDERDATREALAQALEPAR